MTLIDDDEEEAKQKKTTFPLSMYVSEGKYYHKLSKFQTALACFKEGLKIDPKNVPCLVGKTKCLMRLGQYDEASSCADEALKVNPESPEACYLKGDAEYYRENFEESFQIFLESSTKRPNKNNLKKANQLCAHVMENYNPEVLSRIEKDEVKIDKKKTTREDEPPKSKRSRIPYSNVALLRRAYYTDIKFTESLLEDVKDSSNATCQDLWLYLNTLRKVGKSLHPKKSKKQVKSIDHQLHECEEAYREGDTRACLLRGFETLESLDRLPSDQTNRQQKARVFHLMGLSYISRDDLDSAMEFLSKELEISDADDAPGLKFRSWRAIGEVHLKSLRYDEAKDAFIKCLQWPTDSGDEEDFLWCQMKEGYTPSETLEGSTSGEEESVGGEKGLMDFDLQMLLAEIAVRERRVDDAKAIYRDALRIAIKDTDSRAEEEVRNQLKMLEVESLSRSTDDNHDTTNTDDSGDSMVTCPEELPNNVTNSSPSQDNAS